MRSYAFSICPCLFGIKKKYIYSAFYICVQSKKWINWYFPNILLFEMHGVKNLESEILYVTG